MLTATQPLSLSPSPFLPSSNSALFQFLSLSFLALSFLSFLRIPSLALFQSVFSLSIYLSFYPPLSRELTFFLQIPPMHSLSSSLFRLSSFALPHFFFSFHLIVCDGELFLYMNTRVISEPILLLSFLPPLLLSSSLSCQRLFETYLCHWNDSGASLLPSVKYSSSLLFSCVIVLLLGSSICPR